MKRKRREEKELCGTEGREEREKELCGAEGREKREKELCGIEESGEREKELLQRKQNNINLEVVLISVILVAAAAAAIIIRPQGSLDAINALFGFVSKAFGTPLLWFSLAATVLCAYLAVAKTGRIKLGDDKPDFSLFSYIGMMICAGLASASIYFSFIEWIYFYSAPALGIAPLSAEAAEWAPAYSFTYWGLISWPPFVLAALPVAISFYKRKNSGLRFSVVCEDLFHLKEKSLIGKIIDILFVITTLGGMSVTLGLGVPLIASMFSYIFGVQDGFSLQVIIVIAIAAVFSLSSYIGLEKGMKKISDANIYIAIAFVLFLLIAGPTVFILKYTTNGVALAIQNYLHILFWTDPVNNGGFSEAWIIFYICFAVAYAPLMALFITRISKGRTVREMILSTTLGGTLGCMALFGINGGFGIHAQLTGQMDLVSLLSEKGVGGTVLGILSMLPIPEVISVSVFTLMLILFLATSLDAASFSLAAVVTVSLKEGESPNPMFRLFWCVLLALVPLALMFAGAPLSAIQTVCLATATPFAVVILVFLIKSMKWFKEEVRLLEEGEKPHR